MYKPRNKPKSLSCKICDDEVTNVGFESVSVICPTCVNNSLSEFNEKYNYLNEDDDVQDNIRNSE